MTPSLSALWKERFFSIILSDPFASELKATSLDNRLKDWTRVLTEVVVRTCESSGWIAAAKGHRLDQIPVAREEYLSIDVMAFKQGDALWPFPEAAIELENSRDDEHIAYSLWKVLNVRTKLGIVFCYRPTAEQGADLIRRIGHSVVRSIPIADRARLHGETLMVVGYRSQAETFPYGFFKWWRLNSNVCEFEQF